MVFTVNSHEHTQSSRLGDFVADGRTKFTLRTPIISAMNMMSMINLESCVLQTPTYFSTLVLGSDHNAFDAYTPDCWCFTHNTNQYSIYEYTVEQVCGF